MAMNGKVNGTASSHCASSNGGNSFGWLEILEKEFDKSFVDLDQVRILHSLFGKLGNKIW